MFIDFASLKEAITIEEVVTMLGLKMTEANNQLRSSCPACKTTGGRELVVTPSRAAYFCFSKKAGGDLIALTAHIKGLSVKEAAAFLADQIAGTVQEVPVPSTSTSSQEPCQHKAEKLGKVKARLVFEHDLVQGFGLSPEAAQERGIGWIKSGVLANRVLFPTYKNGVQDDYCGINPNLSPVVKFGSDLSGEVKPSNVHKLVPKAS